MANVTERAIVALLLVSIVVSAGNLFMLMQMTGISGQLSNISDKITSLQTGLTAQELFPNETDLYMKAKQEGSLVVYTVWDVQDIVQLLAGFSKRYPGITTTYWQATNPEVVARVMTEFGAGQRTVDVIASDSAPPTLKPIGAIMNYTTSQFNEMLVKDPDVPITNLQVQCLAYNTEMLDSLNLTAPQNWEDVINPQYKGLVALDDPLRGAPGTYTLVVLRETWNNDTRFADFLNGLKALNVPLHHSTGAMMRLVVAGEYAIGFPLLSHDIVREQQNGSPIDYARTDPVAVYADYCALYTYAPHVNAAKLFVEWLQSIEGQLTFAGMSRTPARRGVPSTVSLDVLFPGNSNFTMPSQEFLRDSATYIDQYIRPIWEG